LLVRTAPPPEDALFTKTVTNALAPRLPAASLATAVNVCVPFATVEVSHEIEYGDVVSSARLTPSGLNCTPATPTLSLALAVTVSVPDTVGPDAGEVRETVGGVVSDDPDPDARHPM
jgi:hypothetical protein